MKDFAPLDELDEESDLDDGLQFEEEETLEAEEVEDVGVEFATANEFSQPAPIPLTDARQRIVTIPITDKLLAYIQAHPFREFASTAPRYARLLWQRYAEVRLGPQLQDLAVNYPFTLNVLALATVDDPDTVAVLPVVTRVLDAGTRLQLRILSDEEDLSPLAILLPDVDLSTAFEEWDLPQFFLFDEDWELQGQWGPRPAAAEPKLEAWLAAHPEYERLLEEDAATGTSAAELELALLSEMRLWYNSGLTQACLKEWSDLLASLQNGDEATGEEGE